MSPIDFNGIKDQEEKQFVKQLSSMLELVQNRNRVSFTGFYNISWMKALCEKYMGTFTRDEITFYGGYLDAERQVIGCAAYPLCHEDFPIAALQIKVKTGIGKPLSHRDFLGALLGLGIERHKIGDILIKPFGAYVIVMQPMAEYIAYQLNSIGRYHNIEIEPISFQLMEIEGPLFKEMHKVVSSLRMDVILAAGFSLSRSEAARFVAADKARCNGLSVSASTLVKEGDTLTLRGYGKIKLQVIGKMTKKERINVTIQKYI